MAGWGGKKQEAGAAGGKKSSPIVKGQKSKEFTDNTAGVQQVNPKENCTNWEKKKICQYLGG